MYLGCKVTSDGRRKKYFESRFHHSKIAFRKRHKNTTSNNINREFIKQLLKTLVFSILLYGSDTWTFGKADKRIVETFELWCYKRVLKLPGDTMGI